MQDPGSREPARPCYAAGRVNGRRELARAVDDPRGEQTIESRFRLPPTRAARPARSRGVFLAAARRLLGSDKARRTSVSRLTLAVAAIAATSALIVTAPSVLMDTTHAASRGLALIGAASVTPSFIAKKH